MHLASRIRQLRREVPPTPASTQEARADWQSLACACGFSATGLVLTILLAFVPKLAALAFPIAAVGLGFVLAASLVDR